MRDSEDFLSEDFEWKDEPGPGLGNGSRGSEPSRQPRSLDEDRGRLRGVTAARRRLALLALAVVVSAAIIVAIVLSTGGKKETSSTTPTTSPETTPVQTEPQPADGARTPPAITVPLAPALRAGDHGPAVRTLQRALARLDLGIGSPDGVFGPKTEAAVIAFQRAHDLTADGVVGAKTARAINSAVAQAG